jgi:hypothetical protein
MVPIWQYCLAQDFIYWIYGQAIHSGKDVLFQEDLEIVYHAPVEAGCWLIEVTTSICSIEMEEAFAGFALVESGN